MNALGWAAQPLIPELERYNIKVFMRDYRIEGVIPQGHLGNEMRRWLPRWY